MKTKINETIKDKADQYIQWNMNEKAIDVYEEQIQIRGTEIEEDRKNIKNGYKVRDDGAGKKHEEKYWDNQIENTLMLSAVGDIYDKMGNKEKASEYYNKAIQGVEWANDRENIIKNKKLRETVEFLVNDRDTFKKNMAKAGTHAKDMMEKYKEQDAVAKMAEKREQEQRERLEKEKIERIKAEKLAKAREEYEQEKKYQEKPETTSNSISQEQPKKEQQGEGKKLLDETMREIQKRAEEKKQYEENVLGAEIRRTRNGLRNINQIQKDAVSEIQGFREDLNEIEGKQKQIIEKIKDKESQQIESGWKKATEGVEEIRDKTNEAIEKWTKKQSRSEEQKEQIVKAMKKAQEMKKEQEAKAKQKDPDVLDKKIQEAQIENKTKKVQEKNLFKEIIKEQKEKMAGTHIVTPNTRKESQQTMDNKESISLESIIPKSKQIARQPKSQNQSVRPNKDKENGM